jgi:glycosyltransferase involved in cell wall biosynthesis
VSEPFGLATLEAIQAGVPVIVSKQAGVGEVMPDAIKVDFWDCEALAEAICNVLRYSSLANTLKTNSAERIKNITWNKAAKKLTLLYHEIVSNHHRAKKPDPVLSGAPAPKAAYASLL